jgi:hypothetical protein
MVTFAAVGAAISCLTLLNQYTALAIATDGDYTRTFGTTGSDLLTMLFVNASDDGGLLNAMFFGLWLLPLGYLVIESGYFPKVLGVLLIIGCVGWLADLFARFLAPDLDPSIAQFLTAPPALAELVFVAWLLVKAVRVPTPDVRVPITAGRSG